MSNKFYARTTPTHPMQPNVLLFVTDDHGAWAMPGVDPCIEAPALRHLGETGSVFTNAICTSPVCSPARASLLTGTYPSFHGVHDYLDEAGPGANHPGIGSLANLGDVARDAGYRTGLFGKWHCGPFLKPNHGFDRWFTLRDGTCARFGVQRFVDQESVITRHGHQAPWITKEAIRFIASTSNETGQPWFAVVCYTDTHTPHTSAPARFVHAAAQRRAAAPGYRPPHSDTAPAFRHSVRFGWPEDPAHRAALIDDYRASVEMIDTQIGTMIDYIESIDTTRPTVIVYTSDHGHMNGEFGLHTKGNATVPQNLLHGALHVPLIIHDGSPSAVRTERVTHLDLHETLRCYLAPHGADPQLRHNAAAGTPLMRTGDTDDRRCVAPGRPRFAEYGNARMIERDDWKLVVRYPGPNGSFGDELYRMDAYGIPVETDNEVARPELRNVVEHLRSDLNEHFASRTLPAHDGRLPGRYRPHNPWEPWRLDPSHPTVSINPEQV